MVRSYTLNGLTASPQQRRQVYQAAQGYTPVMAAGQAYTSPTGVTAQQVQDYGAYRNQRANQQAFGGRRVGGGGQYNRNQSFMGNRVHPMAPAGGSTYVSPQDLTFGQSTAHQPGALDRLRAMHAVAKKYGGTVGDDGTYHGTATVDPSSRRSNIAAMQGLIAKYDGAANIPQNELAKLTSGGDPAALTKAAQYANRRAAKDKLTRDNVNQRAKMRGLARGYREQGVNPQLASLMAAEQAFGSDSAGDQLMLAQLGAQNFARMKMQQMATEAAKEQARIDAKGRKKVAKIGAESAEKTTGMTNESREKIAQGQDKTQREIAEGRNKAAIDLKNLDLNSPETQARVALLKQRMEQEAQQFPQQLEADKVRVRQIEAEIEALKNKGELTPRDKAMIKQKNLDRQVLMNQLRADMIPGMLASDDPRVKEKGEQLVAELMGNQGASNQGGSQTQGGLRDLTGADLPNDSRFESTGDPTEDRNSLRNLGYEDDVITDELQRLYNPTVTAKNPQGKSWMQMIPGSTYPPIQAAIESLFGGRLNTANPAETEQEVRQRMQEAEGMPVAPTPQGVNLFGEKTFPETEFPTSTPSSPPSFPQSFGLPENEYYPESDSFAATADDVSAMNRAFGGTPQPSQLEQLARPVPRQRPQYDPRVTLDIASIAPPGSPASNIPPVRLPLAPTQDARLADEQAGRQAPPPTRKRSVMQPGSPMDNLMNSGMKEWEQQTLQNLQEFFRSLYSDMREWEQQ